MITLEFKCPNTKKLYLTVEISHLLHKYNCTYNEIDKIVELLQSWIKQSREENEYDTIDDYINGNKTRSVDNDIVQPMNHVEPYC